MRIEGTLTKWNDDRGFGFITPAQGGPEVFVHITAFPKDGRRPASGEQLTFEVETDREGRKRATKLLRHGGPAARATRSSPSRRRSEPTGILGRLAPFAIVIAIALYGYGRYSHRATAQAPGPVAIESSEAVSALPFRCDGRTHCSQMTSCAEATFFLRNCPDVEMDGDNDGVPCERQWCDRGSAE